MSVQNILRFTADLSRGVVMTPLRMAFIRGEDMGHCFLIQAEQEGKKLPLTGASVNGFMIRADGTTLTIAGTVADGLASLALPAAAYAVPGRFRQPGRRFPALPGPPGTGDPPGRKRRA